MAILSNHDGRPPPGGRVFHEGDGADEESYRQSYHPPVARVNWIDPFPVARPQGFRPGEAVQVLWSPEPGVTPQVRTGVIREINWDCGSGYEYVISITREPGLTSTPPQDNSCSAKPEQEEDGMYNVEVIRNERTRSAEIIVNLDGTEQYLTDPDDLETTVERKPGAEVPVFKAIPDEIAAPLATALARKY